MEREDNIFDGFDRLDTFELIKLSVINKRLTTLVHHYFRTMYRSNDMRMVNGHSVQSAVVIEDDLTTELDYIDTYMQLLGRKLASVTFAVSVLSSPNTKPYETWPAVRFASAYLKVLRKYCVGGGLRQLVLVNMSASADFIRHHALFAQLNSVHLCGVQIHEFLLGEILSQCTSIRRLKLEEMTVTGVCLRRLPSKTLREICLQQYSSDHKLEADILMDFLAINPQLTAINLNDTVLRTVWPDLKQHFANLTTIEFDAVGFNQRCRTFDCRTFDGLREDNLERLFISHFIIDAKVLQRIGQFRGLQSLGLIENLERDIEDVHFVTLLDQLDDLTYLAYISNTMLSEQRLLDICLHTPHLRELAVDVNQFEFTVELFGQIIKIVRRHNKSGPLTLIMRKENTERSAEIQKAFSVNAHIVRVAPVSYFKCTEYKTYCSPMF